MAAVRSRCARILPEIQAPGVELVTPEAVRMHAALARGVSTVLIVAGAAWIALAMFAQDHLAIDPLPGVVALFAGIFVRRKATTAAPART